MKTPSLNLGISDKASYGFAIQFLDQPNNFIDVFFVPILIFHHWPHNYAFIYVISFHTEGGKLYHNLRASYKNEF
jgi:hypothetical protein